MKTKIIVLLVSLAMFSNLSCSGKRKRDVVEPVFNPTIVQGCHKAGDYLLESERMVFSRDINYTINIIDQLGVAEITNILLELNEYEHPYNKTIAYFSQVISDLYPTDLNTRKIILRNTLVECNKALTNIGV